MSEADVLKGAAWTGTTFRGNKLYVGQRCGMFVVHNGERDYVTKEIPKEDRYYYAMAFYFLLHNFGDPSLFPSQFR